MTFAAPIWLWLLVPWAALVYWMLRGQLPGQSVPFLSLWRGPVALPRSRRSLRTPPLWVNLILMALLIAILGASGPAWTGRSSPEPLVVILDRGGAMSAAGGGHPTRFAEAATLAQGWIVERLSARQPLRVFTVPEQREHRVTASELAALARSLPPASYDAPEMLAALVARLARSGESAPIVLSDKPLVDAMDIPRVAPTSAVQNVGIQHIAAGHQQVMVRIVNDSDLNECALVVRSAESTARQVVRLAPRGERVDAFVDLPVAAEPVMASLELEDDLAVDNVAFMARTRAWPLLQASGALPEAVRRVISAYQTVRPAHTRSTRVLVTSDAVVTPPTPLAILATPDEPMPDALPVVEAHPITRRVNWQLATRSARLATAASDDWAVLVHVAGRPVVAVREQPWRQVRVAFWNDQWTTEADFVVFWTAVFDWLGGDDSQASWAPLPPLPGWTHLAEWTPEPQRAFQPAPGIYQREDGSPVALNALPPQIHPEMASTPIARVHRLTLKQSAKPLGAELVTLSTLLILAGLGVWAVRGMPGRPPGGGRSG